MFYKFNIDQNFRDFLRYTCDICRVSNILIREDYVDFAGDFIKVEPEIGVISFIPKSKLDLVHEGFEDKKFRTQLKIGRFVSKFLTKKVISLFGITPNDVEEFVNLYKSYFSDDPKKYQIVSGEEILKWYLEDNYYSPNGMRWGTLWNSCMRQPERNKFMELYAKNPDKIKMLVYLEDSKVRARALLWEDVDFGDGKSGKVMDRIYSVYDHDVKSFVSWANKNGYITKSHQTAKSEVFFHVDGVSKEILLSVKLDNHLLNWYPYLDTFKFYNPKNGKFSNWMSSRTDYVLIQSSGSLEPEREPEPELEFDDDDF
jgi:hypothetical protein